MEQIGVAIIGLGTVGSGVARLLIENGDRLASRAGRNILLTRAVVNDLDRVRQFSVPHGVLTNDLQCVTDDKSISVVAQLIGGIEPAREIMLALLKSGKDIVTANKALLAEHGPELFEAARNTGRSIAFEAAVAGGIPIVNAICQSLSANQIVSIRGILNGTSNYIVTRMDEDGAGFAAAVKQAQQLGFAEADPVFDVDGTDAAQKLSILAQVAFGAAVSWSQIPTRGIDSISLPDYGYARELGFRIKLIALADLKPTGLQLCVAPMLVRSGTPLAEVRDNFNAIDIIGDAVGPFFLRGQGAGQMPTASAVVADLIETVLGRTAITSRVLKLWSPERSTAKLDSPGNLTSRFYLRFNVDDQPGVLAQIAGVLGEHGISIASVVQHDSADAVGQPVPVVIVTQSAAEHAAQTAMNQIAGLPAVHPNSERLRILD